MNIDYKILGKIILNRLHDPLVQIIEREQTCYTEMANVGQIDILRDTISDCQDYLFILNSDQRKACDFNSRHYLGKLLKTYSFKEDF